MGKKPKKKFKKATNAEVAQRVEQVLQMRLAGASYIEISQHSAENEWGVEERQLREYIHKSDKLLADTLEKDRTKLLALHLAQRRLLLNKTMEIGDYRTALSVLRDSAELQGIYPADKTELTGNLNLQHSTNAEDLTDDQLAAYIQE